MRAMSPVAETAARPRRDVTAAMVDDVLERLAVTDRIFHDLAHTAPLVVELAKRAAVPGVDRVLVIAGNALLPEVLREAGLEVELWHHPEGVLTDDLEELVTRRGSLDVLLRQAPMGRRPDMVILPYGLEAASPHPVEVLGVLRQLVGPGGRVLIAYRPAGAIGSRMAGISGRPVVPDVYTDRHPVAFSWPPLTQRRVFTAKQLTAWCLRAGFRVDGQAAVISSRSAVATNALNLGEWFAAVGANGVKHVAPGLRDAVVATLSARSSSLDEITGSERPTVTVVIAAGETSRLAKTLGRLEAQSYPRRRLEALVLLPSGVKAPGESTALRVRTLALDAPVGPRAFNLALREADCEVVAFTDDHCDLPREWVDIGAGSLTNWTAAATGRVAAAAGSATPFLVMPGARPSNGREQWFSTFNSFYVRSAALGVGGFDESLEDAGHGGRTGWETSLAHRIRLDGLPVRAVPELLVNRLFPFASAGKRRGWLGSEFQRARHLPSAVRKLHGLGGRVLVGHLFASWRTAWFDLMVAGLVAALIFRNAAFVLLALPWLISVRRYLPIWPPSQWGTSIRNLRGMLVRQVVWLAGLLVGSATAGRVVL